MRNLLHRKLIFLFCLMMLIMWSRSHYVIAMYENHKHIGSAHHCPICLVIKEAEKFLSQLGQTSFSMILLLLSMVSIHQLMLNIKWTIFRPMTPVRLKVKLLN